MCRVCCVDLSVLQCSVLFNLKQSPQRRDKEAENDGGQQDEVPRR